jgi:hypothetical protein
MTRLARLLLVPLFAVAIAAAGVGCTDKSEAQPNPELGKPPDVKPGRGAGGALDPNSTKAPKK